MEQAGHSSCVFCAISDEDAAKTSDHAIAIPDRFPVSPGHMLIVPRRHVASFFDLTDAERADLMAVASACREQLEERLHPDGYNLGVNDGAAAGQTIMHAHLHLIPRYLADQPDPRGGIRLVFPDKAAYWKDCEG